MTDCLFCRIVAGEIPATVVYETDAVLAFRDIRPKAPVHVLVITKQHFDSVVDLGADPAAASALIAAVGEVARAEGIVEPGFRTIFNTGPDSGMEVAHVHAHLLAGRSMGALAG
ncbi:histidine triad (HIT) family protein [Hamadaea flava]|nr:histidine triad (HIT) family protein [Hamadaea flava]